MSKIVVIGGGLIGMLSAYELSQAGCQVEIYERGEAGQESSWAGGGILSPLYPWRYLEPITELARWSQPRYREFADYLANVTGVDPEWTQSGMLMLGLDEAERNEALQWAERYGYLMDMLESGSNTSTPSHHGAFTGEALWMPDVAQVRNPRLMQALRRLLEQQGITLHENAEVTGIETTGQRIAGIRCGAELVKADRVVICGGAWSGQIAETVGASVPVSPVRGQMLLFRAPVGLLSEIVLEGSHYLIPRRDGHILVGSTLEHVGFNKQTTEAAREELYGHALEILPALKDAVIKKQWAGLRPGTSDGIPFIGEVGGIEGLYVNAGQYRNGVVTGLASARLLRNIVLGEEAILNPVPYRP